MKKKKIRMRKCETYLFLYFADSPMLIFSSLAVERRNKYRLKNKAKLFFVFVLKKALHYCAYIKMS